MQQAETMPGGSYELTPIEKTDPDAIESNDLQQDVEEMQEETDIKEKEHKYGHDSPHAISWIWPVVALAVGCLLYYLIHLQDHNLPTPITADQAVCKIIDLHLFPNIKYVFECFKILIFRLLSLVYSVLKDLETVYVK